MKFFFLQVDSQKLPNASDTLQNGRLLCSQLLTGWRLLCSGSGPQPEGGGAAAVPPRSSPPTCLLMVSTRVHLPGVGSKLVVIGVVAVVVLVSVVVRVERCV